MKYEHSKIIESYREARRRWYDDMDAFGDEKHAMETWYHRGCLRVPGFLDLIENNIDPGDRHYGDP